MCILTDRCRCRCRWRLTMATATTTTIQRLKLRKGCQLLSKMCRKVGVLKRRSRSRCRSKGVCNLMTCRAILNLLVTFSSLSLGLMPCRGTWKILVHNSN